MLIGQYDCFKRWLSDRAECSLAVFSEEESNLDSVVLGYFSVVLKRLLQETMSLPRSLSSDEIEDYRFLLSLELSSEDFDAYFESSKSEVLGCIDQMYAIYNAFEENLGLLKSAVLSYLSRTRDESPPEAMLSILAATALATTADPQADDRSETDEDPGEEVILSTLVSPRGRRNG